MLAGWGEGGLEMGPMKVAGWGEGGFGDGANEGGGMGRGRVGDRELVKVREMGLGWRWGLTQIGSVDGAC